MFKFDFEELIKESIDGELKDVSLNNFNAETVKEEIPTFSSEKLCEMIVSVRYLKFLLSDEIDVLCMEELAKRRIEGSNFNFEECIDKYFNELPVLDFSNQGFDIRKILGKL